MIQIRSLAVMVVLIAGCGDDRSPAPDAAGAPGPWSAGPAVLGGPIQETGAVALDGKIYVIGGILRSFEIVPSVRVFDIAEGTWSDGPDLPAAVHHANVAVADGTLYVLGALQGGSFTPIGDVWSWNPSTETGWTPQQSMPPGSERGAAVTATIDGIIYVAGGLRRGAVADLASYDPARDGWTTTLPPLPARRDHGCGGAIDGRFFVVGGRDGAVGSISPAVFAYMPGGEWQPRTSMPTGRGGTGCAVIDGRIIVVGGEGNSAAQSGVFPQVEAYTATSDMWESLEPMRTPRHGMGAAAWAGRLYVPGGATVAGFGAVDTFEIFTP